jgi:predicted dienelactone hydrolase
MALRPIIAALFLLAVTRSAGAVGFQTVLVPDPGNTPIFVGIWYPSNDPVFPLTISLDRQNLARDGAVEGTGLKLVMMSHGLGGGFAGHLDTSLALAQAGFVAAALTHTGDNAQDHSRQVQIGDRSRQLRVVADWLLQTWPSHAHLDPAHIGVFGFSAGGFTALVAAGGVPDFRRIDTHCATYPAEFTCGLTAQARREGANLSAAPTRTLVHDPRIKAAVVAAPALGFTFGKAGLAGVGIPVQLWRAEQDHTLPQPFYAQAVADDLPTPPDYHVVPNAQHLDFLSPCSARQAAIVPAICQSRPGFDRAAFHAAFNAAVVAFFRRTLAPL